MTFSQALGVMFVVAMFLGITMPKLFVYDNPAITQAQRDCTQQGTKDLLQGWEKFLFALGTHEITAWNGPEIKQNVLAPFDVKFASVTIRCEPGETGDLKPTEKSITRVWGQK